MQAAKRVLCGTLFQPQHFPGALRGDLATERFSENSNRGLARTKNWSTWNNFRTTAAAGGAVDPRGLKDLPTIDPRLFLSVVLSFCLRRSELSLPRMCQLQQNRASKREIKQHLAGFIVPLSEFIAPFSWALTCIKRPLSAFSKHFHGTIGGNCVPFTSRFDAS